MQKIFVQFYALFLVFFISTTALGQDAKISEEKRTLKTYPFDDPNPVPILTANPKIYPYFKYEGYSHEGEDQDWKVVKMENDLVKVFVLPEVGGKVWGAIEKASGHEFIYRNEVMKFRNISMRGPWTSGGIEFNFGIIGHHPSTATPVDYIIENHEDGSVSCTVGNIDLPSRTQWRVKIYLPKDKACFETEALWYNPSPLQQSYYNWMTGAAPARSDFEFFTPGDQYLKHSGEAKPWPIDAMGRDISLYKENAFGPSKSYHVVGEYNDFFGGYYHDAAYGFGHWGEYEAIPGQKLWLWDLSRSGGIWEDLLTDTDGQYIEFQAGRQFLQYFPGGHTNPQTQANFEPYTTDQWREIWFPIEGIGGISDVSENAVMHVNHQNDQLEIGINAFSQTEASLEVKCYDKVIHQQALQLQAMQAFSCKVALQGASDYTVRVKELGLEFNSDPSDLLIERPFETSKKKGPHNTNQQLYKMGFEDMKYRLYEEAMKKFNKVLFSDPYHIEAMIGIAELYFRKGLYEKGLNYTNQALQLDTYHPGVNYITGILYRAKGDYLNAKESFGWAARSMQYRSNAYTQMGEIHLAGKDFSKAANIAQKALDFNRLNINAWQVLAIATRYLGASKQALEALSEIKTIDPLNHGMRFEHYLLSKDKNDLENFKNSHRSELAYQTFLELAIDYHNKGLQEEAIQILQVAPKHPLILIWQAYLQGSTNLLDLALNASPELVFPFRRETLPALEWATKEKNHWKLDYYLSLNLWGKGRNDEAATLFKGISNQPDYAPFYLARAHFLQEEEGLNPLSDLKKAKELGTENWRTWMALMDYYSENGQIKEGREQAEKARLKFPENYAVGMKYTALLNQAKKYKQSLDVLASLKVLPFEGASEGRTLYEEAHFGHAMDLIISGQHKEAIAILNKAKAWPESLGVGKPFDPDERIANYLLAHCFKKTDQSAKATEALEKTGYYSSNHINNQNATHLLGLLALQETRGEDMAKQSLNLLLNSEHGDSLLTRWVAAQFVGDTQKEKEIYDQLFENDKVKDLILLKEIIQLK